ncbi:MAG: aldo/keto reductase, partial [Pseudomonadota bacterium]
DFYGATTDENSFAILEAARAAGVTHIDTSNVYGNGRSETTIGAWIRANPGERERLHIATKAGITRVPERRINNDPDHIEASLDASLKRLGTDYVDLFYIHRRDTTHEIEAVAETLARLIKVGKCKSVGFSEIAPTSLKRAAAILPIAAVQSEYSLQTRLPELGLLQECARQGTALVAFSPVGRSLLTDNPLPAEAIADLAFLASNPRFSGGNYARNIAASEPFRALAAEMGLAAAGLAIAWTLDQGEHVVPIPGTRSVAHFEEYLAGISFEFTDMDRARLDQALPIGWAHGARYNAVQSAGPESYC